MRWLSVVTVSKLPVTTRAFAQRCVWTKGHRRERIAAIDVAGHAQVRGVIGPRDVARAQIIAAGQAVWR